MTFSHSPETPRGFVVHRLGHRLDVPGWCRLLEEAGRLISCNGLHLLVSSLTSKLTQLSLLINDVGWLLRGLFSKGIELNGLKLRASLFQVSASLEKLRGMKATRLCFKDLSALSSPSVLLVFKSKTSYNLIVDSIFIMQPF